MKIAVLRIPNFSTRIQGQKDSESRIVIRIKKVKFPFLTLKTLTVSRTQKSKKHRIPDPDQQHSKTGYFAEKFIWGIPQR
jgi:hypothetical protein